MVSVWALQMFEKLFSLCINTGKKYVSGEWVVENLKAYLLNKSKSLKQFLKKKLKLTFEDF